jgi:hypothetical protein
MVELVVQGAEEAVAVARVAGSSGSVVDTTVGPTAEVEAVVEGAAAVEVVVGPAAVVIDVEEVEVEVEVEVTWTSATGAGSGGERRRNATTQRTARVAAMETKAAEYLLWMR